MSSTFPPDGLHPTLRRQLDRYLRGHSQGAPNDGDMAAFVAEVDAHYREADRDRMRFTGSLDAMSTELAERHAHLGLSAEAYRVLSERNPMPMFVYQPTTRHLRVANDAAVVPHVGSCASSTCHSST